MDSSEKLTLKRIALELDVAMLDMAAGDMLRARERLALMVIALDAVCYPDHAA